MDIKMNAEMIAPCGMNCALCLGYQRKKNHCPSCRVQFDGKMETCRKCIIIHCDKREGKSEDFCYVCEKFPCKRLKNLDKRYRTKYNMSMLENLEMIHTKGVAAFVQNEQTRWRCETCGGTICVHRGCMTCSDMTKRK